MSDFFLNYSIDAFYVPEFLNARIRPLLTF